MRQRAYCGFADFTTAFLRAAAGFEPRAGGTWTGSGGLAPSVALAQAGSTFSQ
jgi:hypothetical protein